MKIMASFFSTLMFLLFSAANSHAALFYKPETSNLAYAYCFNSAGQIVHNCNVTLSVGYYFSTAQHNHTNTSRPVSTVTPAAGNTGTTGLPVILKTTRVGQIEGVVVCADLCTVTAVSVGYTDLTELTGGANWVLIGATTIHPNNHWGTSTTITGIKNVAAQYRSEYATYPVIAINDIALPIGGIFDLNANWAPPHASHSRGTAVDIRGNGRPNSVPRVAAVQQRFMAICKEKGAVQALHEGKGTVNEHFHCRWP